MTPAMPIPPTPGPGETTTTTVTAQPSLRNPETITVETTKTGGLSIKLPMFALVQVLSLAGVAGGAYQITKPTAAAATALQSDVDTLKRELDQSKMERAAILDRLARIETNTENIRDGFREIRTSLYKLRTARD